MIDWRCRRTLTIALVAASSLVLLAAARPTAPPDNLAGEIASLVDRHGDGAEASMWIGGVDGPAFFERGADVVRPTASAIKTFYLIELFDAFADGLDGPLPGASAVLADDAHPAISHFSAEQRASIRAELGGASVRRIGRVMMGTDPASNAVYNAAANLVTAALGGPGGLQDRIRGRSPEFAGVAVRRYMLRDREEFGDNEAPALAFASLYRQLAGRSLPGVEPATLDAVIEATARRSEPGLGRLYDKGGSLASDPLTEVRAGWWATPCGPLVFVVMTEQPGPGAMRREAASERLKGLANALTELVVEAGLDRLAEVDAGL